MRASDFLTEYKKKKKKNASQQKKIKAGQALANQLRKECQIWLKQSNGGKRMLFRGTSAGGQTFKKIKVRQDRKPMDTARERHDAFNQIIADKGLIANRSNALFCSTDYDTAGQYGNECVIFPIGMFNYTWSPTYRDWTRDFKIPGLYDHDSDSLTKEQVLLVRSIFINGIKTKHKELSKIILERMKRILNWAYGSQKQKLKSNIKGLTKKALESCVNDLKYNRADGMKFLKKYAPDKVIEPKAKKFNSKKYNIQGDNGTLGQAFQSKNEIMIHCETAYVIDYMFYIHFVLPYL